MDRFSDKCFSCGCSLSNHIHHTADGHKSRLQSCRTCSCREYLSYSTEFIRVACKVLKAKDKGAISRLEALIARWAYLSKLEPSMSKAYTICINDIKSMFAEFPNGRRFLR